MWFGRKQKNRRLRRGHVLDVKLRSAQVRVSRMRLATMAFGILFGTVFGIYVCWRVGWWAMNQLVYENRAFAIEKVEVQTDGVIAADQLRRWADVKVGDNLFALDLARVKRDLEMVPLIGSVSIERIPPRVLRIRVSEREPIAQVNIPRTNTLGRLEYAVFQLDPEGYVMLPLDRSQRRTPINQVDDSFPVLTGIGLRDLQPGRRLESPQVQAALQLVTEFVTSPMALLVELKRIDVGAPEVLVATTAADCEVTFGLNDLERQLRRWHEIYEMAQRVGKTPATIDLAVSNNIPIRWSQVASGPLPPPKAPKTLRYKRKHV